MRKSVHGGMGQRAVARERGREKERVPGRIVTIRSSKNSVAAIMKHMHNRREKRKFDRTAKPCDKDWTVRKHLLTYLCLLHQMTDKTL